jgi:hypothetical protein
LTGALLLRQFNADLEAADLRDADLKMPAGGANLRALRSTSRNLKRLHAANRRDAGTAQFILRLVLLAPRKPRRSKPRKSKQNARRPKTKQVFTGSRQTTAEIRQWKWERAVRPMIRHHRESA